MTGTPIKITCFITDQSTPNLFWYRQYPQMGPQLMFLSVRADHVDPTRLGYFTASRPDSSHFFLESTGVAVNDSAVYYCAGSPHSDSNTDTLCTKTTPAHCFIYVTLQHNSKRPPPTLPKEQQLSMSHFL
ncbi:UNVERIFIED_CONTAM: hypothetical protein FKN15_055984 [Acipenser sinensis]